MQQITLSQMLANEVKTNGLDEKLARLIETVAACGVEISSEVSCGALMGVLGMAGSENVQGEEQKKLDVISNDIVTKAVLDSGVVAACASEEMDHCVAAGCEDRRPYLICYDPLDGSSTSTSRSARSSRFCPIRMRTPPRPKTPTSCSPATVSLLRATSCTVRRRRWRSRSAAA